MFLDSSIGAEIFFPAIKKLRVKSIQQQRLYGPTTNNYFWFRYPHHFEYLETLKVEFWLKIQLIFQNGLVTIPKFAQRFQKCPETKLAPLVVNVILEAWQE